VVVVVVVVVVVTLVVVDGVVVVAVAAIVAAEIKPASYQARCVNHWCTTTVNYGQLHVLTFY
jgi:hypothetical protein